MAPGAEVNSNGTANGLNNGDSHPPSWVPIKEEPAYTPRKIRLICAGAGYSGLTLAFKIKYEFQLEDWIDLVIYEKNPDVGGTWFENHYPGIACDIPAHSYTFLFEPNPDWSSYYASGPEIQTYIKKAVRKWSLDEKVQFNSRITEATWDEDAGKWNLIIDQSGAAKHDSCDIFVNATGFLNRWKWPGINGLSNFKGKMLHTAGWDDDYDWHGKKVAVIGNGSSGIQATTAMSSKTSKLINYVRNPTWVSLNLVGEHAKNGRNFEYSEEERKEFKDDPKAHFAYRRKLEGSANKLYFAFLTGHPAQLGLKAACITQMSERMEFDPELSQKMIPDFEPGCRRLTPGDGYIEAFKLDHVQMCWEPIDQVTEKGIRTEDGKEEEFDLIVCATGFETSYIPLWKMTGRDGATLEKRWAVDSESFFSLQVDGMPNYFIFYGPSSPISHASVPTSINFICNYVLKWVKKIATEDIKSMEVKRESVEDFTTYTREILTRTAWGDKCRSWYKDGKVNGPVTGPYGGSFLHWKTCLENIGAEHFNFTYRSRNRFRFLGNGEALGEDYGAGTDGTEYLEYYTVKYGEIEKSLGKLGETIGA